MQVQIGTCPDSWGVWFPEDDKQTPWNRCLDEMAEAGYEWTELGPFGYLPTDLETLRGELDKRGLKATASFAMAHLEDPEAWPEVERQVNGFGELLQPLGVKYLVLIDDCYTNLFTGEPIKPKRLDDEAWKRLIDATNRVGQLAKERYSLQVVFHPHANTHVEYEDQIEALLDQTDPDLIALCLDTGHRAYCGGDPIAFMRKHHARIPYLHLKSVDPEMQKKVEVRGLPSRTPLHRICLLNRARELSISMLFATCFKRLTSRVLESSNRTCTRPPSTNRCRSASAPARICKR
jgi:inosose dehydratase